MRLVNLFGTVGRLVKLSERVGGIGLMFYRVGFVKLSE